MYKTVDKLSATLLWILGVLVCTPSYPRVQRDQQFLTSLRL